MQSYLVWDRYSTWQHLKFIEIGRSGRHIRLCAARFSQQQLLCPPPNDDASSIMVSCIMRLCVCGVKRTEWSEAIPIRYGFELQPYALLVTLRRRVSRMR